jgi:hypothetical protein
MLFIDELFMPVAELIDEFISIDVSAILALPSGNMVT